MLAEGFAGGTIPAVGPGAGGATGAGWVTGTGGLGDAGGATGAGCGTGGGVRGAGAGTGAAATAASGGEGIVVVGAGDGGAVVEVVVVACSASRIRRIFTSADSARMVRGDAVPLWPWRPWAEATAAGPAVAARTVAPGSDTMRPKRAIVRLAGRRAFWRAFWRALWRAF
jgi:hypothetical protein